jgi:hypothetical protein
VVDALRHTEGLHATIRSGEPSTTAASKGADQSDHARFTAAVSQLGKEIHSTTMKLQELAKSERGGVGGGAGLGVGLRRAASLGG